MRPIGKLIYSFKLYIGYIGGFKLHQVRSSTSTKQDMLLKLRLIRPLLFNHSQFCYFLNTASFATRILLVRPALLFRRALLVHILCVKRFQFCGFLVQSDEPVQHSFIIPTVCDVIDEIIDFE